MTGRLAGYGHRAPRIARRRAVVFADPPRGHDDPDDRQRHGARRGAAAGPGLRPVALRGGRERVGAQARSVVDAAAEIDRLRNENASPPRRQRPPGAAQPEPGGARDRERAADRAARHPQLAGLLDRGRAGDLAGARRRQPRGDDRRRERGRPQDRRRRDRGRRRPRRARDRARDQRRAGDPHQRPRVDGDRRDRHEPRHRARSSATWAGRWSWTRSTRPSASPSATRW